MGRTAEALDGLAILGVARVGSLALPVPAIAGALAEGTSSGPFPLTLTGGPLHEPGRRALVLRDAVATLTLEFQVPAPEVTGVSGAAEPMGDGAWFVHWPLPMEAAERLRAARPELIALGNARTLWDEGEPFAQAIHGLRRLVGAAPILWAPRVALPHRMALLAYLGVDLVDSTETLLRARAGAYFDAALGIVDASAARREGLCRCPSCRSEPAGPLPDHGLFTLEDEGHRVRAAIRAGRLRELVEARLTSEPLLAEVLRYADRELADLLDERTPVVGDQVRTYVLAESRRRPEIRRFRRRFLERYRPPPSKRVLVVLPCSRTKPYRSSRSHRRFASAFEGLGPLERVHVVSVTSPLGIVPRELEDMYPARNYDIPVTGQWDEDERTSVTDALARLLDHGPYSEVIFHLDPGEYEFLRESGLEGRWTLSDGRTTSAGALASLRSAVAGALEGMAPVTGGPLTVVREELRAVAGVQFGPQAADLLFAAPARLAGRPWFQRLTDGAGTDLATWREPRGLFQLTVAGGHRMWPAHPVEVEVDPRVELKGDLFTPGVVRADPSIRTGDAVVLSRAGEMLAVGEAAFPGPLMTELPRGTAVWVRHRVHPVAAAPTST